MRAVIILWLMPAWAFAQSTRVGQINIEVAHIDKDRTLSCDTLDASVIFKANFDGGGEVLYWYRGKELVKVREEIGLSWGRNTREYYFHNDTIMLFREREELFPWIADSSALDHSRLITGYEGTYYFWTWRNELLVNERGRRSWPGPPDEAEIDLARLLAYPRKD